MDSTSRQKLFKSWFWISLVVAAVILAASWIFTPSKQEKEVEKEAARPADAPVPQTRQARDMARYGQESFSAAVKTILPSVVSICAFEMREGAGPANRAQQPFQEIGSGIIVNPNGYVLTNYHVVVDADDIKVTRFDGDHRHVYDARLSGVYPEVDLAILQISTRELLPTAMLGNSDKAKVGDWVLAVGSPFGLDQSVSAGIVSATRQTVMIGGLQFDNLLQTDASISPGNSGGPLVNIRGEVIGISTAIPASPELSEDIGFCIPSNMAKDVLDQAGVPFLGK